jgi:hypothetical protein
MAFAGYPLTMIHRSMKKIVRHPTVMSCQQWTDLYSTDTRPCCGTLEFVFDRCNSVSFEYTQLKVFQSFCLLDRWPALSTHADCWFEFQGLHLILCHIWSHCCQGDRGWSTVISALTQHVSTTADETCFENSHFWFELLTVSDACSFLNYTNNESGLQTNFLTLLTSMLTVALVTAATLLTSMNQLACMFQCTAFAGAYVSPCGVL